MSKFIEISDVTKTYWSEDGKTETKVILPLSLTIAEGEMVSHGLTELRHHS